MIPTGSYVIPAGAHKPVGQVFRHDLDEEYATHVVLWPTGFQHEDPRGLVLIESPRRVAEAFCDYAGCHESARPETPFCDFHHDHEGTHPNQNVRHDR